ncbi:metalloprotease family protein [Rhodohalobacter sp. 8-1]|uniref:metalloprotease family protein n=1 Tax=Rhodohalobacter sp. 8-1 TaxID=3131972 RepID=UPI0030EB3EA0
MSFFLPSRFKGVKFGFDDQHGIPFVHIKEPISVPGFRIGAIMPLIILGLIPIGFGMTYGIISLTAFGVLFTISASGDLLLIARTKGIPADKKLKDMPDRIGFEIVEQTQLTLSHHKK